MDIDLKEVAAKNQEQKKDLAKLERDLAIERAKVTALSDAQGMTVIEKPKSCKLRFGLLSDTHIGSLYFNAPAFAGLFAYYKAQGIRKVYHAGDVLSGHKMYKGHEYEVHDLGFGAQLERLAALDTCGVQVHFITGNHDASFKSLAGVKVGEEIAVAASTWRHIGDEQARIRFETPNGPYDLHLIHPGGGTAYAVSYKPQKIIESLGGGTKPNMIAIGHYHKAEYLPSYRNVASIQTGTLEKQTPFMARQGLAAHVGGWLIEVDVGKTCNVVKAEFVAFYV